MASGNSSDLIVGQWGGLDVTVGPHTLATTRQVRVFVAQMLDIAVRRVKSFVVATDLITT